MKNIKILPLLAAVILLLSVSACSADSAPGAAPSLLPSSSPAQSPSPSPSLTPSQNQGQIYLYGEIHGVKRILDKEFELWYDYYHNRNMRHLFIEYPCYTAEFFNIWMQSDNDDVLNELYDDWAGTQSQSPLVKEFYQKIKSKCPETVFHGTDVGHFFYTTGYRYLKYLRDNNLEDSEKYILAQEAIEQGKHYYENHNHAYRENKMAENFTREYDSINGESVMGIYGAAHTGLDAMDFMTGTVPCMANQLKSHYGDIVHSEDYTMIVERITISGKAYDASYFGQEDMSAWSKEFVSREFWRLNDAYDYFKNRPKTGDWLPYDNYPMPIETGQVFVIDYTKKDGSVVRMYHRSDGLVRDDEPITEGFSP